jgi:hypothetical protein
VSRDKRIRFGSFGKLLNTPVHACAGGHDWWFFLASEVQLEGEDPVPLQLAPFLPQCLTGAVKVAPQRVDAAWFWNVAPIGLNLSRIEGCPGQLGFVVARADRQTGGQIEDVAYRLLLVIGEDDLHLHFSGRGPAREVREEIAIAFGMRLLW